MKEIWKVMQKKQRELDEAIYRQKPESVDWEWYSLTNAKRLKLNILVEIGEFANELKTFKLWRNKKEIDLAKAKEELVDCLCFFLGLWDIYQIDFVDYKLNGFFRKELDFNDLLLDFFFQTENLIILEDEAFYKPKEKLRLTKKEKETYYRWLRTFNEIVQKLSMDEEELLTVYLQKNDLNHQRVSRGY